MPTKEQDRQTYEAIISQLSDFRRPAAEESKGGKKGKKVRFKRSPETIRLMIDGKKTEPLPRKAVDEFLKVLKHLARGDEVRVTAGSEELTTQKAADLLHVSRPFLVSLLEKGEIPFHKVGTHRRIRLDDLLSYKQKIDAKRLKTLEELAKQAQELDMGY